MKIIVDGQLVNYSDQGVGKVVLLLHGWGATLQSFDGLSERLARDYRVLSIDFPGFGGSPRPDGDWNVGDYAKLIEHFLEKKKVQTVHALVGHSFGGRVILKAVGQNYLTPKKVVLLGSAGVKPESTLQKRAYRLVVKTGKHALGLPGLRKVQAATRRRLYEKIGSTDYLEANELQKTFLNVINEDLLADAAKISQPSLLIWGEQDTSTPVADGKKLASVIQHAELVVLPGAGHFVYLDKADEVAQRITEFL